MPEAVGSARRASTHVLVALGIVLLMLSSLAAVLLSHFAQDSERIKQDRMQLLTRYGEGMRLVVGETLVNGRAESLPVMLKNLTPAGSSIVSAVLDDDYRAVFASRADWHEQSLSTQEPGVLQSMSAIDREGRGRVIDADHLHLLLRLDQPVRATAFGEDTGGWLYLRADMRAVLADHFAGLQSILGGILLLAVAVFALLAWWLWKRIGEPLEALAASAANAAAKPPGERAGGWASRMMRIRSDIDSAASLLTELRRRVEADERAVRLLHHAVPHNVTDASEQALVQGACDRLVQEGFASAWAAVVDTDGPGLRFVARAGTAVLSERGFDTHYLGLRDQQLFDLQNGRRVTSTLAAFTGEQPAWRQEALSDGCVGMAVVPLRRRGVLAGILLLLVRQADLLDDVVLEAVQAIADSIVLTLDQVSEAHRHRHAGQDIERNRAMLRAVVDSIPDLIFFKDMASVYLGCNPAFERLVAKREMDIVGGTDFACFSEEQARQFRADDERMLSEGRPIRFVEWVDYPDGRRRLLESLKTPFRDTTGRVLGLVGIARDITAQHQSRKELEAERALFVAGPTVMFRWRPAEGWPVEYVSPNVLNEFGYQPDALTHGKTLFADLVHPDDLPHIAAEVRGCLADPACTDLTQRYRLRHANGSYRWVLDQTSIRRDKDSGEVDLRGYLIDFSDAVANESRLRERVKELNGLYAVVRELSGVDSDVDDVLQAVVDALPPSFQFPELASARLRFRDRTYLSAGFAASRWVLHEAVELEDGFSIAVDVAYSQCPVRTDEEVFLREEADLIKTILLELVRFNARRAAEQQRNDAYVAVHESAQRLRVIAESSSDLLYQADAATGERHWLTDIGKALGFDRAVADGAVTRQWSGLIHPEDLAEYQQAVKSLRSGRAYSVTYRVRVGDGSWRFMRDRGDCVESNGERMIVGACTDVTDIRLADEERERVSVHLRRAERMETLGMLARGLTVDLNNKLMSVSGFADIAQRRAGTLDAERLAGYLDRIRTAADQAAILLQGITDFSEMNPKANPRLQVAPVVEKALALVRPSLTAGVILKSHVDPGLPAVVAVPGDLLQVVVNLCLNSIKSLGHGGEVGLSLTVVDEVAESCSACDQAISGRWLALSVTDTGASLPEEIRSAMFDPALGRPSYERPDEFVMAAVHRIVMANGGHLVLDALDTGSNRVRVFLPPAPTSPAEEPETD